MSVKNKVLKAMSLNIECAINVEIFIAGDAFKFIVNFLGRGHVQIVITFKIFILTSTFAFKLLSEIVNPNSIQVSSIPEDPVYHSHSPVIILIKRYLLNCTRHVVMKTYGSLPLKHGLIKSIFLNITVFVILALQVSLLGKPCQSDLPVKRIFRVILIQILVVMSEYKKVVFIIFHFKYLVKSLVGYSPVQVIILELTEIIGVLAIRVVQRFQHVQIQSRLLLDVSNKLFEFLF